MKRFLLFILLAIALKANSQGFSGVQGFLSDIVIHPTSYSGGKSSIGKMAFDGANNKYALGWFDGKVDIDPGTNTQILTSTGSGDFFVIKEDAGGNLVWVKQFPGLPAPSYGLSATEIDVDASGNVYLAGSVRDSVDLDPGPGVFRFYPDRSGTAFILKLDASGNFVWAKRHEVDTLTNWSFINGLKVIGNALYASVSFVGTVDLDPDSGVFHVISNGSRDIALVKMDTAGNFIWGKSMGSHDADYLNAFTTDSAANLYITGAFADTVDFDPGPGVYALTPAPWRIGFPFGYKKDIFVAKYDSAGNLSWAQSFGAHYDDDGRGVAVDRSGNVYISGYYTYYAPDTLDFDPGPGSAFLSQYRNDFLLKLRSNGDFVWVKNAAGSMITTDDSGHVYCFIQKIDSSGNIIRDASWQDGFAGSGLGNSIKSAWFRFDNHDTLYVSGSFSGMADFDPGADTALLSCLPYTTQSGYILKLNKIYNPYVRPAGLDNESLQPAAVSVYPNPSSGIVTFTAPTAIHRIRVTDLTGKVVYQSQPGSPQTTINLIGKATGIYFYEADCDSGKERGKLVIH